MSMKQNNQRGYAALSIVLLLSVIAGVIVITSTLLGIGEGQAALALTKGEETLHFVEGCMEDALLKIRQNASYAGGSITRPEGTCSITVAQAGSTYTVTATTPVTTYKRSIQAVVQRGSSISITSWKEQ
jgi:Na+-transporting NADH:ubiquinone oxidoreductase subunit NqrC